MPFFISQTVETLSPELIAAYRRTIYRVFGPFEAVDLRIDEYVPALEKLLEQRAATEWAIVSAANPASRLCSERDNEVAHARLEAVLAEKYATFPAVNLDPSGKWPPEKALFILSISCTEALALAARFGQNAIVHGVDAIPRLVII